MKQLLLFEEPIEIIQERKIESLKESLDKMRKSLHAKNSVLQKEVKELKSKLEFLEAHICKGNLFFMKWISVLDKVPGNERKVLVWLEHSQRQLGPGLGWFDPFSEKLNHNGWFVNCGNIFHGEVTYWAEITIPVDEEIDSVLEKRVRFLESELEFLKSHICKGNLLL